jgi:hypothetical protein
MFYLASSKVNVAVLGNFAFALTLAAYRLALKVPYQLPFELSL